MSDLYQIEQPAVKTQEAYSAISRPSLRANLSRIRRDETLFHYTWLALLVKSIVFLGLVNNDGVHFNLIKAFQLFTNQPFFMIYICFDFALLSVAFLFKGKLHYWTLVFCNFLLSFVMIVDLMNFRAFSNFISVYVLFLLSVAFLFKGKLHYWTLVFCNFLLSFVMIVDLMNFRAFSNFISVYV